MAQQEQCAPSDAWARVKSRLRAELGEDVFASWFRGVEVEHVDDEVVHLTVATRFLRNWLRSHYYDFVLRLSRGEWPTVERLEFKVRQPHFGVETPKEAPRAEAEPGGAGRRRIGAAAAAAAHRLWRLRGLAARSQAQLSRASWSAPRTGSLMPRRKRWPERSRPRSLCSILCSCTAMWASAKPICCMPSPGT